MTGEIDFPRDWPIGKTADGQIVYGDEIFMNSLLALVRKSASPARSFLGAAMEAGARAYGFRTRSNVFFATTQPLLPGGRGDLWFNPSSAYAAQIFDGTAWVSGADNAFASAVLTISGQRVAGVTLVIFYRSVEPTAENVGDIWYLGGPNLEIYRWDGKNWILVQDSLSLEPLTIGGRPTQDFVDQISGSTAELEDDVARARADLDRAFEAALAAMVTTDEIRSDLGRLGFVAGAPLGGTITNLQETTADSAESLSLLGARSADGEAFILDNETVRVSPTESLASRFTALEAGIADVDSGVSAVSSGLSQLTTRVTSAEGTLSSQSSQITSLSSRLTTAEAGTAANASAVSALTTRVTSAEGSLTAQSSQITSLSSRLTTAEAGTAANATAVSALTTRVTSAEGSLTAQSSQITQLSAEVDSVAASVTLNAGAIASIEDSAAYYEIVAQAGAGNLGAVRLRAGQGGSALDLIATVLRLANVSNGQLIEVMRAVDGRAVFGAPVSAEFGGRRLTIGPGFGANQDVVLWFGSSSVAVASCTRTNGDWAFGTDGRVYYKSSELLTGGLALALSTTSVLAQADIPSGGQSLSTANVTATVSGGSPPYTYTWTRVAGDESTEANSPFSASCGFSAFVPDGGSVTSYWRCLVSDSAGVSGSSATVTVELRDSVQS